MTLTQPVKIHGGKHYLAKKLIALMPRHLNYVEPFAGGLSVLLARDPDDSSLWWSDKSGERGVSEVANDIDGELMNFWDVIADLIAVSCLRHQLEATPFCEVTFDRAINETAPGDFPDPHIARAYQFFIRARQSRQGLQKDFATLTQNRTRRGMNEQASSWLTAIDGLPDVHARLKGVVILNQPALDVIRKQDGPKTLFYLDPPYLHETRRVTKAYKHEMTAFDHACLLSLLSDPDGPYIVYKPEVEPPWTEKQWNLLRELFDYRLEGNFMLSGYRSPMYDEIAQFQGWRRVEFELPNHAGGGKKKRVMTECVWMNYDQAERPKEE